MNEQFVIAFHTAIMPEGIWVDWLHVTRYTPQERLERLAETRKNYPEDEFRLIRRSDELVEE